MRAAHFMTLSAAGCRQITPDSGKVLPRAAGRCQDATEKPQGYADSALRYRDCNESRCGD
jgi:hypothetical protein